MRDDARKASLLFAELRRDTLVSVTGMRYEEFRQTLTPKYPVVWRHLLSAHVMLVLTAIAIGSAATRWPAFGWLWALAGGVVFGYTLAYIILFFHEAAHYNLTRSRALNDRLANVFIGIFQCRSIQLYRPIHFDHHRHLGETADPEHTYFDPLSPRFVLESLTGVKPVRALLRLRRQRERDAVPFDPMFPAGLVFHAIVLGSALAAGLWPLAFAWAFGVGIVFPFLAALRQLLEHRDDRAIADLDYTIVRHGVINRMFGTGLVAGTFGGAGFNRHMLHHWEAQISYTRLAELEEFLRQTDAAPLIGARQTTYAETFLTLLTRSPGSQ